MHTKQTHAFIVGVDCQMLDVACKRSFPNRRDFLPFLFLQLNYNKYRSIRTMSTEDCELEDATTCDCPKESETLSPLSTLAFQSPVNQTCDSSIGKSTALKY